MQTTDIGLYLPENLVGKFAYLSDCTGYEMTLNGNNKKVLINLGSTSYPQTINKKDGEILNKPEVYQEYTSSSKRISLKDFVPYFPETTSSLSEANLWFSSGIPLVGGIDAERKIVIQTPEDIKRCIFIQKYFFKKRQIEFSFFRGREMMVRERVRRKSAKKGMEEINWMLRTRKDRCFGFVMPKGKVPQAALELAKFIFEKTGLDFGKVEILVNKSGGVSLLDFLPTLDFSDAAIISHFDNEIHKEFYLEPRKDSFGDFVKRKGVKFNRSKVSWRLTGDDSPGIGHNTE